MTGRATWTNWVGNQTCTRARCGRPRRGRGPARSPRRDRARRARARRRPGTRSRRSTSPTARCSTSTDLHGVSPSTPARRHATALPGTTVGDVRRAALGRPASRSRTRATSTRRASPARSARRRTGPASRCESFSATLRARRLVTARGERRRDRREPTRSCLRAAQVAVGMLGVMTEVELDAVAGLPPARAH